MFSILLALAVNSYVDARKEHTLTERALRGVRDELTMNLRAIQGVRAYHDTLALETQAADAAHQSTSFVLFRAHVPSWRGLHNPPLDATAWQSAITLGTVANMGYDTVRALSAAYEYQTKLDQYIASSIPTFDFSDAAMTSTARRIYVFMETTGNIEDSVEVRYTKALKLLDTASSPKR